MPCKDAAEFLEDCIQSILSQTYENWELLVVDDHSSDQSFAIMQEFQLKDNRIHLFENKGVGIVDALTLAFQQSNGSLINRMDADDMMPKEKLATLCELIAGREKVVATANVKYYSDTTISEGYQRYEKWLNGLSTHQDHAVNCYRECVIASPNWMVHRSCFEQDIDLSCLQYPEDYDMAFKWLDAGYQIMKSTEVTHLWREHDARTSRTSNHYQQKSFFKMKTRYWVQQQFKPERKLVVIGNNMKSKLTSQNLKELKVGHIHMSFDEIKAEGKLDSSAQYILCNWPISEKIQGEITSFLRHNGVVFGENIWLF